MSVADNFLRGIKIFGNYMPHEPSDLINEICLKMEVMEELRTLWQKSTDIQSVIAPREFSALKGMT